jgi:integrase
MNNLANNNQHKVVKMNQSTVFSSIQSFLRDKGVNSKNTKVAYENDIRFFFSYTRNKDIENLIIDDLRFKNSDIKDYRSYLYEDYVQLNGKKFSNITINRKVNTIISLFRHLKTNDYDIDPQTGLTVFDPDKMKVEDLPQDVKQTGFLTVDEVNHMLLMTNDEELKAYMLLSLHTSMRKDSILNLKWEQITPKHDEDGWFIVRNFDKGEEVFKEIHKSIYEMLLNIKKDDVRVFLIPASTLDYRFKALCKKAGIDKYRKVSIHSLRKAGIDFVKQYTGDIHAAQHQANHSSSAITDKCYVQKPKNIAARLLVENVDEGIFDDMSREELLELVQSFGNGIGHQLRAGASKIVGKR